MTIKNKLFATSATAALVVSAMVPVASAAQFNDAEKIPAWAKDAVEALVNSEVLQGDDQGNFNPTGVVTRAVAAEILSKAKGLSTEGTEDFSDVKEGDWFYKAVVATSQADIFEGNDKGEFKPNDVLTREQAAAVIVRAFDLAGEADLSKFADADKVSGWAKETMEIAVANGVIKGSDKSLNPTDGVSRAEIAVMVDRVVNATAAQEITSVKAVNPSTVTINFSKAVDALEKADVVVTNKENSAKQIVKFVELAEDGLSAEVVFHNALEASSTYEIAVTAGETTTNAELEVGTLTPAKIEADAVQVVDGSTHALKFKVLDETGVDITDSLDSKYAISYTSSLVNNETGVVKLNEGAQTTTKIQVKEGTEVVVESAEITIKAEAPVAKEISNWTVGTGNFADDAYEQKTSVALGDTATVKIEVKDQFGNVLENGSDKDYTVEYSSLDTSVAIVDKGDGKITPLATGKVPVKIVVKQGDKEVLTKTVEIQVAEVAELTSINLDKESVTISNKDTSVGVTVKATLLDQFENKVTDETTVTVDKKENENIVVSSPAKTTSGEVTFTVKAKNDGTAVAGSYEVDVYVGEVKTTLTVVIAAAGAFAGYDIRGLETVLDLNKKNEANTPATMNIVAVAVDANGNAVGGTAAVTSVIKDKDGKVIENFGALTEAGNYKVEVSVNGSLVKTHEFEVVDTTEASVIEFTSTSIKLTEGEGLAELLTALEGIAVINGTKATDDSISGIKFNTNAAAVVPNTLDDAEENGVKVKKGTATIYVSEITLDGGEKVKFTNKPIAVTVVEN